jgi:bacillopeptidase F
LQALASLAALSLLVAWASSAGASAPVVKQPPAPTSPAAKISNTLRDQFRTDSDGNVRYLLVLSEQADVTNNIRDWKAKGRYVFDKLVQTANATQPKVSAALQQQQVAGNVQRFKSYYIINAFQVVGNLASAENMANLSEVGHLVVFPVVTLDEPVTRVAAPQAPNVDSSEWNVEMVNAPQAWALGYDGTGVTVGSLDTGQRWTHEAIKPRYRGWNGTTADHNFNWWDSVSGQPAPHDENGHGTHTVGTILGIDVEPGDDIHVGVAPGAKWISSNGIADGASNADIIEAGQFMIAPWDLNKQNANPDLRPVVVSNSWGYGVSTPACPGGDPLDGEFFRDVVDAWVAAGIFPSFSAGNDFPHGNRIPAAYPETFETGALARQNFKASYSSEGPSCFDLGQHPQIMAGGGDNGPGLLDDLVRSSYNTGDTAYDYLAGTSMAQPATAGAVAILKQANPNLTIPETWYVLTSTALFDPSWGVPPSPLYGWGKLQIDQAVLAARALIEPTVTGTPPTATQTSTPTITRTPTNTVEATATPACTVSYYSSDVPKTIIDIVPITSSLQIQNGPIIAALDVISLTIAHTYPDDLTVLLTSPSGTTVELFTGVCGGTDWTQQNTGFTLSDRSHVPLGELCPPGQGTYEPQNPLSAFIGEPSTGTWVLEVDDAIPPDEGTLHGWGLRISSFAACGATNTPTPTVTGTPPTATSTLTATATLTATSTLTATFTATATSVPSNTLTPTQTPSRTATATIDIPTPIGTSILPSPTGTIDIPTAIPTSIELPTLTGTPLIPTETGTATGTPTNVLPSATSTSTSTNTSTRTPTNTATRTATATLTPTATATICPVQFQDVPPSTAESSFYPYVRCLACRHIIGGYPCGDTNPETDQPEPCGESGDPYYRPSNQISRGQISKVVAGASGSNGASGPQIYEDVPPGSPFYVWINRLSNEGVMGGYPCGGPGEPCQNGNRPYFRPGANATRGQMSKIVSNAAGFDDPVSGQSFEDLPPSNAPSSYYQYVERLYVRGVVSGYPCGSDGEECGAENRPYFRPNSPVTRGQAAKIAANTFFPNCQTAARR